MDVCLGECLSRGMYAQGCTPLPLKARSHGAFFFCVFAMQKMDYVGVNEGVHMVRFQVRVMH